MKDEVRSEAARATAGGAAEVAYRIAAVEPNLGQAPQDVLDGHRFDRDIARAVHARHRAATGNGYIFQIPPSLRT